MGRRIFAGLHGCSRLPLPVQVPGYRQRHRAGSVSFQVPAVAGVVVQGDVRTEAGVDVDLLRFGWTDIEGDKQVWAAGTSALILPKSIAVEPNLFVESMGGSDQGGAANAKDKGACGREVDVGEAVADLVVRSVVAGGDTDRDASAGGFFHRVVDGVHGLLRPDIGTPRPSRS